MLVVCLLLLVMEGSWGALEHNIPGRGQFEVRYMEDILEGWDLPPWTQREHTSMKPHELLLPILASRVSYSAREQQMCAS